MGRVQRGNERERRRRGVGCHEEVCLAWQGGYGKGGSFFRIFFGPRLFLNDRRRRPLFRLVAAPENGGRVVTTTPTTFF